jgi:hypothetical protein
MRAPIQHSAFRFSAARRRFEAKTSELPRGFDLEVLDDGAVGFRMVSGTTGKVVTFHQELVLKDDRGPYRWEFASEPPAFRALIERG